MNRDGFEYQPPKAKIYRFESNDRVLTESGIPEPTPTPDPIADFAANSLNKFFGGTNTTKE